MSSSRAAATSYRAVDEPSAASRIVFTVAALLACRLGTFVPLPGLDPSALDRLFGSHTNGLLGMLTMGGVQRVSILALSLNSFITASLVVQVLSAVTGSAGKVMNRRARYLAVILAVLQSYGVAAGLEGMGGIVDEPGFLFRLATAIELTGGTVFLMWLGEEITARGVGNGFVLIVMSGILTELPGYIAATVEFDRNGVPPGVLILGIALIIATVALIVFVEGARRRLHASPGRQTVALRVNGSGAIAPLYVLMVPRVDVFLDAALMVLFVFVCIASTRNRSATKEDVLDVFAGDDAAGEIGKTGGPASQLQVLSQLKVRTRLAVIAAAYLVIAGVVPELLLPLAGFALPFGGSVLLVVVIGSLDVVADLRLLFRPAIPGQGAR